MNTRSLTTESVEHKGLSTRVRHPRTLVGAFVGSTLLLGTGLGLWIHNERPHSSAEIIAAAEQDGLNVTPGDMVGTAAWGNDAQLSMDLGKCVIDGVQAKVRITKGKVDDVYNYSFSGYSNANVHEEMRATGGGFLGVGGVENVTVAEGNLVTFRFENAAELQQGVLGPDPCQTLSQMNFVPEQKVDEANQP